MEPATLRLDTSEAMALVGIGRTQWDNHIRRGLYSEVPPIKPGQPRYFQVDDLVALHVLATFQRLGVTPAMACRTAAAVRKALRKGGDALETLWVVSNTVSREPRFVVSKEPPDTLLKYEIQVAHARREIIRLAAERLARKP